MTGSSENPRIEMGLWARVVSVFRQPTRTFVSIFEYPKVLGALLLTLIFTFAGTLITFDILYDEGQTQPKMMSVGLHPRLIGHPARAMGLKRFLDYIATKPDVWVTRRLDIAKHWVATHPYPGKGLNE